MQVIVNGKNYRFMKNIKADEAVFDSFNQLAMQTFGLSFEVWYRKGFWQGEYIPHVLLNGGCVVSNVSVNLIHTCWQGQKKLYIQLGTVMTSAEYRNRGLSRFLVEQIIAEWKEKCDAIYLFANDSVLDFYPKFGFVKADEYQCELEVVPQSGDIKKLDMDNAEDVALLLDSYKKSNPFSALPSEDNTGLLMFYCGEFLKDAVYYSKQADAVVIAEYEGVEMTCYDIFCDETDSMQELLSIAARLDITGVKLGFTPKDKTGCKISLRQEEDTLFVLGNKENIFAEHQLMFPLLSHA